MVKNPYIIIQARMGSERLPGKVLMNLGGKPLIEILIERLKKSNIPILLATSINDENDPLVEHAMKLGIETFRGSENNVLERYYLAAKSVNADLIIRATGDNPLMDGELIKQAYQKYLSFKNDRLFLSIGLSKTFPLGISSSFFSFKLLEETYLNATHPGEFEHVTPYMFNNNPGNISVESYTGKLKKYHIRLTVDTQEDYKMHKILIEKYKCEDLNIEQIIEIIDNHPELLDLNSSIEQKKWNL